MQRMTYFRSSTPKDDHRSRQPRWSYSYHDEQHCRVPGCKTSVDVKHDLQVLVSEALKEHLDSQRIASPVSFARANATRTQTQLQLKEACKSRLRRIRASGPLHRPYPSLLNAFVDFIEVLDEQCPDLQVSAHAMLPSQRRVHRSQSQSSVLRLQQCAPGRPTSATHQSNEDEASRMNSHELLSSLVDLQSFLHDPARALQAEREQAAALVLRRERAKRSWSVAVDGAELELRLRQVTAKFPTMKCQAHPLHHWLECTRKNLSEGHIKEASDYMSRIDTEVMLDEKRLRAAFEKFDHDQSGNMEIHEFRHFAIYVGLGSEMVDEMLRASDQDQDGVISFEEFSSFVGRMGGVRALFKTRRSRLNATGDHAGIEPGSRVRAHFRTKGRISKGVWDARVISFSADGRRAKVEFCPGSWRVIQEIPKEWIEADVDVVVAMQEIGIQDDAQHFWTILLPLSEQQVAKSLAVCQRAAISNVRTLATSNHAKALPELIQRAAALGIEQQQLWAMLTWIRDMAPIIIHVNLDKVGTFLENDSHYRNQFETQRSCGLLSCEARCEWERDLFGSSYDEANPFERPKYGVLNVMNDYRGVLCAQQYGDSYLTLKSARLRCTFAPEDSGGMCGSRLAVLDQYAHVLLEYGDNELLEVARVANSPEGSEERIGDSLKIENYNYKEAQIHGEIHLQKHVHNLVVSNRHQQHDSQYGSDRVKALCSKHGWELVWMEEEHARRIHEGNEMSGPTGFKVNWTSGELIAANEVPDGSCASVASDLDRSASAPISEDLQKRRSFFDGMNSSLRDQQRDLSTKAARLGVGALSIEAREKLLGELRAR